MVLQISQLSDFAPPPPLYFWAILVPCVFPCDLVVSLQIDTDEASFIAVAYNSNRQPDFSLKLNIKNAKNQPLQVRANETSN